MERGMETEGAAGAAEQREAHWVAARGAEGSATGAAREVVARETAAKEMEVEVEVAREAA